MNDPSFDNYDHGRSGTDSGNQSNRDDELRKELLHKHRLMQYIIEHATSAIAVLDRDMKYIYVSKRFIDDYKVKETDVLGRSHYSVFPGLPDRWKEAHKKALSGEVMSSEEDSFTDPEGHVVWVKWVCRPWFERDGSTGGIVLYTEVITEEKKVLDELTNAKEKAEESDKLKTAFLQNISHEVRTPLNSIVGFAELLSEPGQSLQKMNSYSKIISANSQKLIRIISDMIEISQIHSHQVKLVISNFDVVASLHKVANNFMEITQLKEIDLVIDNKIKEENSFINSDKGKIEKIYFHLIDNAVKFTGKGSIRLTIDFQKHILYFNIIDTGIGIPHEKQDVIFYPFRQLETGLSRNYGGTGLGLTIVKAYIDALNGNITLSSIPGTGTEINITIPVSNENDLNKSSEGHDHDAVNTILIAEDEYSNFKYLYEALHSKNMEILHANNGKEAVDICRKSNDITMILMDLKMPVLDGTSAARQIKEFRPELPIIAQSAYVPDGENINSVFDDHIAKPIDRNDLKQKMSRFIHV